MSRPFKVGDIVNGWCKDGEKIVLFCESQVISSIDGEYHTIDGFFFIQQYLTLVTPVEDIKIERGVETYKDQFTPWREESLRDDDPKVRAVANEISIMMEQ